MKYFGVNSCVYAKIKLNCQHIARHDNFSHIFGLDATNGRLNIRDKTRTDTFGIDFNSFLFLAETFTNVGRFSFRVSRRAMQRNENPEIDLSIYQNISFYLLHVKCLQLTRRDFPFPLCSSLCLAKRWSAQYRRRNPSIEIFAWLLPWIHRRDRQIGRNNFSFCSWAMAIHQSIRSFGVSSADSQLSSKQWTSSM